MAWKIFGKIRAFISSRKRPAGETENPGQLHNHLTIGSTKRDRHAAGKHIHDVHSMASDKISMYLARVKKSDKRWMQIHADEIADRMANYMYTERKLQGHASAWIAIEDMMLHRPGEFYSMVAELEKNPDMGHDKIRLPP